LSANKKKDVYLLSQKILHEDEKDWAMEHETLQALFRKSQDMHEYIINRWWPDRSMWLLRERRNIVTFSNNTNNRVESENGKLKQDMLNSNLSLAECVRRLMAHNAVLDSERCHQEFLQDATQVIFHGTPPDLQELLSQFTDYAAKEIIKQVTNSRSLDIDVKKLESGYHVVSNGEFFLCQAASKPLLLLCVS
jgi:hypothetical protein